MRTVKLDEIPEEGLDLTWEEDQESLSAYLGESARIDFGFETPLRSEATVRRVGKAVLVKGTLKAVLRLQCVRCLKEFTSPLATEVDMALLAPEGDVREEGERELTGQEMELSYHNGEEINLSEIVFEQVFLEIPYQPLCRSQCKGLCQVCGTDLNLSACGCVQERLERGFSALQKLKLDG